MSYVQVTSSPSLAPTDHRCSVVQRTQQYSRDRFPTDVYYPTLTPTLRLVTCGPEFDPGHYRSNVVVLATMAP